MVAGGVPQLHPAVLGALVGLVALVVIMKLPVQQVMTPQVVAVGLVVQHIVLLLPHQERVVMVL